MLTTNFLGKKFKNPLVLASGILGVTAASLNNALKQGCGGVTVKSVSLLPRSGHPNPTMAGFDHFLSMPWDYLTRAWRKPWKN